MLGVSTRPRSPEYGACFDRGQGVTDTSVAITVPADLVCQEALAEGKDPYPSQANGAVEGFVCPKLPDSHAYCAECLFSEAIPALGEVSWLLFCPGHGSVEVLLPKAPHQHLR